MRALWIAALWGAFVGAAGCARRTPVAPSRPMPDRSRATEAGSAPTYICHRSGAEIIIDGQASEEAWQDAEATEPFSLWDGDPAVHSTRARLLWDARNLYVAVECNDPDIQGTMSARDQNLWEENEVVELFADANGDERCYLEFEINPLNTVLDLIIPEAGGGGSLVGKKCWDAKGMETAVVPVHGTTPDVGDIGWSVEMAIPLEDFLDAPNCPPREGDEWRVNLYRVDQSNGEVEFQAWSPTHTEEPSFHVPDQFGILRFTEASPGEQPEERGLDGTMSTY